MVDNNNVQRIVIVGIGGGSRDLLDIVEANNAIRPIYEMLGFVVDPQYGTSGTIIHDYPVLGGFDWLEQHKDDTYVICGVGAPHLRANLIERATRLGVRFCTLIHPTALLTRRIEVGLGSSIGAGCILTNQIKIGNHVYINIGCTISHDNLLENYVTLSPGVHLAGNVILHEGSFVGIGANIIEKITIGRWSIIGAGSTVIKNVPDNTTAVGVPAKVIKTRPNGWHLR